MVSLDDKLEGGGTRHDIIGFKCPGGAKPRPLKSSWAMHDRTPPPPRKEKYIFYVDNGDVTVSSADCLEAAYACCVDLAKHGIKASIRPYKITEESLQEDERFKRWKSQHSL